MNKKIKAALKSVADSLPPIEYKNQKSKRLVFGWELIANAKAEAEATGKDYIHPQYAEIIKKGVGDKPDEVRMHDLKPSGKYYADNGCRKVNHYDELVKIYRQNKWPGVEAYQAAMREVYSQVDESK